MPTHPLAVKFYSGNNTVAILTLLKKPNKARVKILKTAYPKVTLPSGDAHPIVRARGRLVPTGSGNHKWLVAVLEYDPSQTAKRGKKPCPPGGDFGTSAMLEITITNVPNGEKPEEFPITVEDPEPGQSEGPPLDGDVDLLA